MYRAKERAGPEDVGEQALMRGLGTAFPFVRLGLSLSKIGRRSDDRPRRFLGSSPAVAPPSLLHDYFDVLRWLSFFDPLIRYLLNLIR